ncbi:BnaAnng24310D [Brassica napus]|uniref:BnaAnng24310D protein n=2 Tax=Brassica TaxID=3705 RepID=A0A078JKY5_BRANA|nr:BnaAnng24310D [Brassica napus]VDC70750.1 unnamed protein product [Brassica rapa]
MFNSLSDTIILDLDTTTPGFVFGVYMNEMDQIPCSNSITVCESSSGSVPEAVIVVSGLKEKAKEKEFHMIDLSGGGEESDNGQRICRICHFGSDQTPDRVSGKFLRGNSVCEICGSSALNVPVRLTEEECSEIKDTTTGEGRRRGSGQSCCIFMVFLLTIILLHWFFKKMSGYYQNT